MRLSHITLECRDVRRQQDFWHAALDPADDGVPRALHPDHGPHRQVAGFDFVDKAGDIGEVGGPGRVGGRSGPGGPVLRFVPAGPSLLDEVARLTALGATVVRKYHSGWGFGEVVMADPEGNEFLLGTGPQEESATAEERMQGDRGDGGPFWADAVPPKPRGVTFGVAFAANSGEPQPPAAKSRAAGTPPDGAGPEKPIR